VDGEVDDVVDNAENVDDVDEVVVRATAAVVAVDVESGSPIWEEITSSGTASGIPVIAMPASSEITATRTRSSFDLTAATG
jgi:hypothetical protein